MEALPTWEVAMRVSTERVLFWAPRLLVIVFAAFVSVFALDVFDEYVGFWATTGALLLHLIPSGVLLLILVIAWRRDWFGALLFGAIAVLYVATSWGRFPLVTYLTIAGPAALAGLLFLAHGYYARRTVLATERASATRS
jgi:hypothetical protein